MLTVYCAVLRQGKSVQGEQAWFLSWFLEDTIAMETIFWENEEATECRAYLGVEGSGAAKPLCSASVVFRLQGPFPSCKFDVCCGASGLCVVSWEKRTLSPSLNCKLRDREPVDGAQDYTAQACVLWHQHSSFQSSHVWVSPLKMASWYKHWNKEISKWQKSGFG